MPDIVLGALIGIGGGIVGAIIGALSSYIITNRQINARRDEFNQQLSHQDKKAQREWLIQDRKEYLSPLRHTLSEWVECSHQQTNMTVRLKTALGEYDEGSAERKAEIQKFLKVTERITNLTSRLAILSGLISDGMLDKLIDVVKAIQLEVATQRMPMLRFYQNPSEANADTIESVMQKDELLLKKVRSQVLKVNKRIEELLSGEPST